MLTASSSREFARLCIEIIRPWRAKARWESLEILNGQKRHAEAAAKTKAQVRRQPFGKKADNKRVKRVIATSREHTNHKPQALPLNKRQACSPPSSLPPCATSNSPRPTSSLPPTTTIKRATPSFTPHRVHPRPRPVRLSKPPR